MNRDHLSGYTSVGNALAAREPERLAILRAPVPANPSHLLKPVRVRVLKAFFVGGKRAEPGDIVLLATHDADSLTAVGRCEKLD